jgi:hypothetical protein
MDGVAICSFHLIGKPIVCFVCSSKVDFVPLLCPNNFPIVFGVTEAYFISKPLPLKFIDWECKLYAFSQTNFIDSAINGYPLWIDVIAQGHHYRKGQPWKGSISYGNKGWGKLNLFQVIMPNVMTEIKSYIIFHCLEQGGCKRRKKELETKKAQELSKKILMKTKRMI